MGFVFSLMLPIVIVLVIVIIGLSCVKVVKQSKLTDFEKILVFTKIACGLLIECESAIKIDDDVQYICENISDTLNQYIIPMKKGDKMDG